MKKIIIHWTAGFGMPTAHELECYHYLIDTLGKLHQGKFKPEDNLNCEDNKYAHHTGGGNTGSIGVSMCGMVGFQSSSHIGSCPITKVQFEACMKLCAELAKKYDIKITPDTIMTHYEFGQKHPDTTSYGKIDIIFIPPYSWLSKDDCGSFIRSKIGWYQENS